MQKLDSALNKLSTNMFRSWRSKWLIWISTSPIMPTFIARHRYFNHLNFRECFHALLVVGRPLRFSKHDHIYLFDLDVERDPWVGVDVKSCELFNWVFEGWSSYVHLSSASKHRCAQSDLSTKACGSPLVRFRGPLRTPGAILIYRLHVNFIFWLGRRIIIFQSGWYYVFNRISWTRSLCNSSIVFILSQFRMDCCGEYDTPKCFVAKVPTGTSFYLTHERNILLDCFSKFYSS